MKKIYFILIAAAAMILSSCSDFLDVKSKSSILEADYYNSQDRLFSGLVAAYDPLHWYDYFYQYDALNMVSDIMADDINAGGSNDGDQPVLVKTHFYTATANDVCNQIWTISYSGINRANIVIAKAPDVEMEESIRNQYVAEAKVLKCFYWNQLWKFWGNVPYYDVNLTAADNYSAEQLPANDIYTNVIATLEEAIGMNALPMKSPSGSEGRVTLAMAYMLYTEMVMYQNDESKYPTALGYMKEIINSNLYSLESDFAGIWFENKEWCAESIWEINYESEGGVRSWDAPIACGGAIYPVLIGIPGYKGSAFVDGWGFGSVNKTTYDAYESGDLRRDGGILNFAAHAASTGDSYTPRWQDTGYFLLKYIGRVGNNHGYAGDPNMNQCNNTRMYRYSEVLLNAAELAVRTGGTGADEYLHLVRSRAGVGDISATVDNIIEERHLEFVGEGKRYWDLVRTGKASTVLAAGTHIFRENGWSESKKYWPIPQSEIDKSATTLVQNPY